MYPVDATVATVVFSISIGIIVTALLIFVISTGIFVYLTKR